MEDFLPGGRHLVHALIYLGIDLLEQPGDTHHTGGPHLRHIVHDRERAFGKGDMVAVHQGHIVAGGPLQHVGKRQETEAYQVILGHSELSYAIFGIDHDVALGEQHALRHPGGAGGVDDGDDIVLGELIDLRFDLLPVFIRHGRIDFRQLLQGVDGKGTVPQEPFVGNHQVDVGQLVFHLVEFFVLGLGGAEDDPGFTVVENIGGLLAGVGGIDRHGYAAR